MIRVTTYGEEPRTTLCKESPVIAIERRDVELRGGHGTEVAVIRVLDEETEVRFWVRLYPDKDGNIACSVNKRTSARSSTNTH